MRLPIESAHKTAGYLTLVPAYGRDYKSKREVMEAWDAGKDFMVQDMMSPYDGKSINKADAKAAGIRNVNIRYKGMRSVAVIKVAKTAFGEKMQSATEREYNAALRNAPRARKEHIDGGPRSMTVEHSDRGTLVASKTIIYSRGKVSQEMYMVNADYLPGGSMARQAKFPKGQKMTVEEVAEYFRAAGNDKAADDWLAMHEKNKDVIKDKAKKQARDLLPLERRFAREDEGKMSESEKKKFLEENPALAKNVEDPPKEVEALKEKMKGKKARLRRAALNVSHPAEFLRSLDHSLDVNTRMLDGGKLDRETEKRIEGLVTYLKKTKEQLLREHPDLSSGKKANLRRAARRHFAGRRYDYDEVIDFLTDDNSTPELERMWKKWSAMVEDLHDRWFEGWAEANAPELLDESIDYAELAWKAFGSVTGMGIGLWEGDFLGDAHDEAFEKVVERDSKVSRFGQDLDDEISMAREGDDEESMRMASRRKMLRKAFVPDSVDGWLEWEDGSRTAASRRRG